jgi:histidinol phosphatase-like enzyme
VCERPWIFFDLGDVLVDTRDWDNLRYNDGARDYVLELRRLGFTLGLIVNIPESWGADQAEKLARLQSEIAETWREPEPFVWSAFDAVLLPPNDSLRKPAPYLFEQARSIAGAACTPLFQGENAAEVTAAEHVGMTAYHVGVAGRSFFKPL